jgi:hypothetical protein
MTRTPPFVDQETGRIDRQRVLVEAIPVAELVGLVAAVALVPFAIAVLLGPSGFRALFVLLTQFALAVGSGVVLIHVVSRGVQLGTDRDAVGRQPSDQDG